MASSDYNTKRVKDLRDGEWFSLDNGETWHRAAVVGFGTVSVYVNALQGPDGGEDAPTTRIKADQLDMAAVHTYIDHTDPATFALAWLAEADRMPVGGPYVTAAAERSQPASFTVRHMTHTLSIPGASMLGWDLRRYLEHNPRPVPAYLQQRAAWREG